MLLHVPSVAAYVPSVAAYNVTYHPEIPDCPNFPVGMPQTDCPNFPVGMPHTNMYVCCIQAHKYEIPNCPNFPVSACLCP